MKNVTLSLSIFLLMITALAISGCGEDKQATGVQAPENLKPAQLPGMKKVAATVGDNVVSEFDVQQTAIQLLGVEQSTQLDDAGRKKLLDSIVMSKAIAQARISEMTPLELAHLNWEVENYREQALVRQYLRKHAKTDPVTPLMIKEYYEKHPEKFGGGSIKEFEMIAADKTLQPKQRAELVGLLNDAKKKKDWQKLTASMSKKHFPVSYRKGLGDSASLKKEIRIALANLKTGEASNTIFNKGKPFVVRVVNERVQTPKPLAEVSAEIRKMLSPDRTRKAIEQVTGELMKTANVVYSE